MNVFRFEQSTAAHVSGQILWQMEEGGGGNDKKVSLKYANIFQADTPTHLLHTFLLLPAAPKKTYNSVRWKMSFY